MAKIQSWNHSRKGRITGIVVKDEPDWLTIQLTEDHAMTQLSTTQELPSQPGQTLAVRKSFLTEITED